MSQNHPIFRTPEASLMVSALSVSSRLLCNGLPGFSLHTGKVLLGLLLTAGLMAPAQAVVGGGSSGGSESRASENILTTATARQLTSLLSEAGFDDYEIDKDGDIVVKMQNYKVLLLVGTNKNAWLLFKFAISGTGTKLKDLNEWNKHVKYSRAYIDDDGDVILESDQDLDGGVTPRRLIAFFKSFDVSLEEFIKRLE